MKDELEAVLAIMKEVNLALTTLDQMGVRFTGVLDVPILLKALKVL